MTNVAMNTVLVQQMFTLPLQQLRHFMPWCHFVIRSKS